MILLYVLTTEKLGLASSEVEEKDGEDEDGAIELFFDELLSSRFLFLDATCWR